MKQLPSPIKRHLMGARPDYSARKTLHQHFKNINKEIIEVALKSNGYLTEEDRLTQKAADDEIIAACDKKILWSVVEIHKLLEMGGLKIERQAVNQTLKEPKGLEPVWANLGTIGTYFSATAPQVGKWLDELGLREDNEPTQASIKAGLATHIEMNAGGKKTRQVTHWNLHLINEKLVEAGHELDFNYEESLRGKGKNSDVEVSSLDSRAVEFAKDFARLYKSAETRWQCRLLVQKTPRAILVKAENLLKKPGFITSGRYLNTR